MIVTHFVFQKKKPIVRLQRVIRKSAKSSLKIRECSYENLEEELPRLQEDLVVLHEQGEHGVLVLVAVQNGRLLRKTGQNVHKQSKIKQMFM